MRLESNVLLMSYAILRHLPLMLTCILDKVKRCFDLFQRHSLANSIYLESSLSPSVAKLYRLVTQRDELSKLKDDTHTLVFFFLLIKR